MEYEIYTAVYNPPFSKELKDYVYNNLTAISSGDNVYSYGLIEIKFITKEIANEEDKQVMNELSNLGVDTVDILYG